ncbi:MAG TPA: GspH/FimT family pseudopilin [Nitrospiria bacterium]|nr:GspH/FimT family pseudopilin [Nitrospiria bacterium]
MVRSNRTPSGYTLIEILTVLGIAAIVATIAWPATEDLIERAELSSAARTMVGDIRLVQREARVSGRTLTLIVDPGSGSYAVSRPDTHTQTRRLAPTLRFGLPDNPASDGVTFRDNTVFIAPRPGPQSSIGSISITTRRGAARRVTVSLTGHTAITVWDGRQWN